MVSYILWTLLIYVAHLFAYEITRLVSSKGEESLVSFAVGPRDGYAAASQTAQRCGRAQKNLEEAMFIFMPVALLLLITGKADGIALTGALIFVIARAAYLPAYIIGTPWVRPTFWTIGVIGLGMMVVRLHQ